MELKLNNVSNGGRWCRSLLIAPLMELKQEHQTVFSMQRHSFNRTAYGIETIML